MPYTANEIAQLLQAEVVGDGQTLLKGFAPADRAQTGDLTFAENDDYLARAEQSAASAIIVSTATKSDGKVLIRVPNARVAFARTMELFFPEPPVTPGIHPTAVIAQSAQVDATAAIGPNCIIGERVRIGAGAALHGGDFVGDDCKLGDGVVLFPNVTLYAKSELGQRVRVHAGAVIGSDGFGYVLDGGAHRKVAQIGNVIIGDDVEIGANVTIDRGALKPTIIGKGTKIDNLVQIGHNVEIGEHCLLIAQSGVAGSSILGNYVALAGQVGVAGHLKLGDRVTLTAQSGVMDNVPAGEKWMGTPAQPDLAAKRTIVASRRLPALFKRIKALEKKLGLKAKE